MKKILLVVDMQKDFIDGSLGTKEAEAIVDNVVQKIDEWDGDVIATLDTHSENYLQTAEGRKLPVPHCIKGTDGWKLNEKIRLSVERKKAKIVEKPTFGSVELAEYIKERYADEKFEIELVGLCTDICVISNALLLKAYFPENEIGVDARCCAGVTPDSHKAALVAMKMCQITVAEK